MLTGSFPSLANRNTPPINLMDANFGESPQKLAGLFELINECKNNPFKGTGKPEPLKDNLTGYWSRRINQVDRLVYLPEDNAIYIVACRFHY